MNLNGCNLPGKVAVVTACMGGQAMALASRGAPADLAWPVVFLASAASGHLHGHTLADHGGWPAR